MGIFLKGSGPQEQLRGQCGVLGPEQPGVKEGSRPGDQGWASGQTQAMVQDSAVVAVECVGENGGDLPKACDGRASGFFCQGCLTARAFR